MTEELAHGIRTIHIQGFGGPYTSIPVKRGSFEAVLPGASFVNPGTKKVFVAWDGERYVVRRSLLDIQSDPNLTLIGSVGDELPVSAGPGTKNKASKVQSSPSSSARMPSTVHSPAAVRKIDAFMAARGLNQTEFAIQAKTTDKTIRKIRQTATIKRSMLNDIAKALGMTREELLKES